MSKDPMRKGGGTGFSDLIPRHRRGEGSINPNKDYYTSIKTLPGRILFVGMCVLPYIGVRHISVYHWFRNSSNFAANCSFFTIFSFLASNKKDGYLILGYMQQFKIES